MEDALINTLNELIQKGMQTDVRYSIFGSEYKRKPRYISASLKRRIKQRVGVTAKGLPFTEVIPESAVLIDVYFGDPDKLGRCSIALERLGTDEESIRKRIEPQLHDAIHTAAHNFAAGMESFSFSNDNNLFFKLSKEPVVQDIDPIPPDDKNMIPAEQTRDLELKVKAMWDIFQERKEYVHNAQLIIRAADVVRRFVDSAGTKIRSQNFRANFRIELEILTQNARQIEYVRDDPYYVMTLDKLLSYDYLGSDRFKSLLRHVSELSQSMALGDMTCPTLVGARAATTMIHEPTHLLTGKYIVNNESPFAGRIGQQIMSDVVAEVVDDPGYTFGNGYYQFDDEGVFGQRISLIKDGCLASYFLDRNTAGKLGVNSNGHARTSWPYNRAEGTVGIPEGRASNMFIRGREPKSERKLFEQLIERCNKKGYEYGLVVKGVNDAGIDIRPGDLNLYPFSRYAVHVNSGRMQMISGNHVDDDYSALQRIVACGDNEKACPGNCGADSGTVPDSATGPALLFDSLSFKANKS